MYEILWSNKAKKQLRRLEKRHQEKIVAMADSLKKNPYHKNTIKMKGFENRHRLKEGQFRVIYSVYKKQLIVDILDAGFRQGVYKK